MASYLVEWQHRRSPRARESVWMSRGRASQIRLAPIEVVLVGCQVFNP